MRIKDIEKKNFFKQVFISFLKVSFFYFIVFEAKPFITKIFLFFVRKILNLNVNKHFIYINMIFRRPSWK